MRRTSLWAMLLLTAGPAVAAPAPDLALRGTVTAADGSPAAGAIVWAARHTDGPLQRGETRADDQGRFALNLGPGEWYVWARLGTQGSGGRSGNDKVTVAADRAPAPLAIRLEERGRLRGRLLEAESGRPLPGGRLFLDAGLILTADDQGRFEIGGLYRGSHESFTVCPGRLRQRVLFDTTAKADTELDIPLPRAGRVVGRVTDEAGRPVAGAYVGRGTSGSYFSINALYERCDEQGRFVYDGVTFDRRGELTASAPGYEEDSQSGWSATDGGPPPDLRFRLKPKPADQPAPPEAGAVARRSVSGAVRGPDGKPLEGALVHWGVPRYVGAPEARTDRDGHFRLALCPDEEGHVAVSAKGLTPAFPKVARGGDQEVLADLATGSEVRGVVRDDAGASLASVLVIPSVPEPPHPDGVFRSVGGFAVWENSPRTDAEGRFRLTGVSDQTSFTFLRDGLTDLRNQRLQADGSENVVVMQAGGAIRGRVVDAAGRPVRNFRIRINAPRQRGPGDKLGSFFAGYGGTGIRFTADDGTFVVTQLTAGGLHRVTAVAEGYGEASEDRVTADPLNRLSPVENLTLKLGPPHALRVRAVAAGKPVIGARVVLVNGDPHLDGRFSWGYDDASWEETARARTGDDGWAVFPKLTFGGATVAVQAPGFARQRLGWRTGAAELTVALEPEAVLTGEVRDAAGQPVEEFSINLMGMAGDQVAVGFGPKDGGKFRFTELAAGDYTLWVRSGRGNVREQVTLKAGETIEKAVRLTGR